MLPDRRPAIEYRPSTSGTGGRFVSIIRVGLTETKGYGDGYDAIFKKGKSAKASPAKKAAPTAKKPAAKKAAPTAKKPTAKKK